jgi:hypothetical protein
MKNDIFKMPNASKNVITHKIISPSMSLTGLSLEIYIIHFVAKICDCITRDHSDQSSHNWCCWKGFGLDQVLKTDLIVNWDYGLHQFHKKVSKFLKWMMMGLYRLENC